MYRSVPRLVRSQGNFLKGIFGKEEAKKNLTQEERDQLRQQLPSIRARESTRASASPDSITEFDIDDVLDTRFDKDSIRARGFLKYKNNYAPSADVKDRILRIASEVVGENQKFDDNLKKFEFLKRIGEEIGHWPTNSILTKFDSVEDVVQFYETPVKNITAYTELARDENKPKNVSIIENAVRFHPEDTHLHHGGITAYPGTGGEVLSLRQKRLLRQFQPKKEWFDYDDQTFDYTRADKDMPWDSEVANQMDRYTDKRYNLKTKQFTRIRQ